MKAVMTNNGISYISMPLIGCRIDGQDRNRAFEMKKIPLKAQRFLLRYVNMNQTMTNAMLHKRQENAVFIAIQPTTSICGWISFSWRSKISILLIG